VKCKTVVVIELLTNLPYNREHPVVFCKFNTKG